MAKRGGVGREVAVHKLKLGHKSRKGGSKRGSSKASAIPSGENVYFGYSGQLLVGGYVATVAQAKEAYKHHLVPKPKAVHGGKKNVKHKTATIHKPRSTGKTSKGSTHHTAAHPMKVISTPHVLGTTTRRFPPPPDNVPLTGAVF